MTTPLFFSLATCQAARVPLKSRCDLRLRLLAELESSVLGKANSCMRPSDLSRLEWVLPNVIHLGEGMLFSPVFGILNM